MAGNSLNGSAVNLMMDSSAENKAPLMMPPRINVTIVPGPNKFAMKIPMATAASAMVKASN
jgi:hypothetical protein